MQLSRRGRTLMLALSVCMLACATHAPAQDEAPQDATLPKALYEQAFAPNTADAWFVPQMLETQGISAERTASGTLRVVCPTGGQTWGNAMVTIPIAGDVAAALAPRETTAAFRLTARVRVGAGDDIANASLRAQLWCRVDRAGGQQGFFDNSADRAVTSREWATATIVGEIAPDAQAISIGLLVAGPGSAEIDDVRIELIERAQTGNEPPAALDERGAHNLGAFARAIALIEHFHPTDEAIATDWPAFATSAIKAVEAAEDDDALVRTLRSAFASVAPGARFWQGRREDDPGGREPGPIDGAELVGVVHHGRGLDLAGTPSGGVYRSFIRRESLSEPAGDRTLPPLGAASVVELASGVWARVPHVLIDAGDGTLPRPDAEPADPLAGKPEGWRPNAHDRASRIAGVARAWGTLRHFYPYFDVIQKQTGEDWEDTLEPALRAAATATDNETYARVVAQLAYHLHDGHGFVGPMGPARIAPVEAAWVGDELVALSPAGGGVVQAGDVVEAVDGRSVADLVREQRRLISASTSGYANYRLTPRVLGTDDARVTLSLRSPNDITRDVELNTIPLGSWQAITPERPALGEEVAPGVRYVDLNGLAWPDLAPHLDLLAAADGVIFDLRGYPDSAGARILQHLTDELIHSAYWKIPVQSTPTLAYGSIDDVEWQESRWNLAPLTPRIGGGDERVVFITDGRAISYAESCLAIVEAYELAEIVGGRTAGSNGNINQIALPGPVGLVFTGMRVVKHDGETVHQGVGVIPTIECTPTIEGISEGRDELLERAIEIALHGAPTPQPTSPD